jgi:hypothetical protein
MRFEVLMAVMVFRIVTPCWYVGEYKLLEEQTASMFNPKDEGSILFQKVW